MSKKLWYYHRIMEGNNQSERIATLNKFSYLNAKIEYIKPIIKELTRHTHENQNDLIDLVLELNTIKQIVFGIAEEYEADGENLETEINLFLIRTNNRINEIISILQIYKNNSLNGISIVPGFKIGGQVLYEKFIERKNTYLSGTIENNLKNAFGNPFNS
jgi:hypothetical protein